MKNFILTVLVITGITNTSNSQSGWFQQNSNCNKVLFSVSFLNLNTGIIVGERGKILMTRNGGTNWDSLRSPVTNILLSVCIIDSNTIMASGFDRTLIKTTNFGMNWYRITNNGYDLNEIKFPNAKTGYIASSSGIILKTTTAGETWFDLDNPDPFALEFYSLSFIDANTGFVVGFYGTTSKHSPILKTTNGGENWARQESSTHIPLLSVRFINPDTGLICGGLGIIRRTTNGGMNWNFISGPPNDLGNLTYVTDQIAYAVGSNGIIVKTNDGGINWEIQNSRTIHGLSGVYFTDSLNGFAVGDSGTILKTTTGGVVGITKVNNTIPEKYFLYQNYPNPFNPSTTIKFSIANNNSFVKLTVYNNSGKEIVTLVNGKLDLGTYEVDFDGSTLPSGVYFYRIETRNFIQTKKMIFLK